MWSVHAAVIWDVRDILVDLRTDFQFGNDQVDTFAFTTTIGVRYVWYEARRFAIYTGIDVEFGFVTADQPGSNPNRSAFVVGGNTGILLPRHSDSNLDLRARLVLLMESLQGSLPVLISLGLGLRF